MSKSKLLAGGSFEATSATVTLVSAAGTLNKAAGRVTTEALTTAAEATETFTITCDQVDVGSVVAVVISEYAGAGTPVLSQVNPADGSFVVTIVNSSASTALNAALKFDFVVLGEIS